MINIEVIEPVLGEQLSLLFPCLLFAAPFSFAEELGDQLEGLVIAEAKVPWLGFRRLRQNQEAFVHVLE